MKNVTILGSTGSIGRQTLEIIADFPNLYKVDILTAHSNIALLEEQCKIFKPNCIVITDANARNNFLKKTQFKNDVFDGEILKLSSIFFESDIVVSALVGIAGLLPTINAIKSGKTILFANKEILVVAGNYIMNLARKNKVKIIPIDSEHSAIYQCLLGEKKENINKIILTASGGPFLKLKNNELQNIKAADALKHPTWNMGTKVTIDSATMMNKGFEAIEAKWLFGLDINKIDVVIHPQSIIHSMVEFVDGSVKAQLSPPDMRFPISFALAEGNRIANNFEKLDFNKLNKLEFSPVPKNKFPCLDLVFSCAEKGGNACAILNAANEIAVSEFIKNKINFLDIPRIIETALANIDFLENPSLDDLLATDAKTREYIQKLLAIN